MTRPRPIAAALAAALFLAAPLIAAAQQAAIATPEYTAADLRAVLNARIAALKAVLELTPEQEKLWPAVEGAIRASARNASDRFEQRSAIKPVDFLQVLDMVAAGEEARARDIRSFIAAAKPLVASLNKEQKRRMPAFLGMTDYPGQPSGAMWLFQEEEG
jgi:LTXXQ motif family protein